MTTSTDKSELWRHMRGPVVTFAALLGFLAINVAIGWFQPFRGVWAAEGAVMLLMIATVLLFSMEVIEQPALVKFFSILGFLWVGILFGMTMIDYVTR